MTIPRLLHQIWLGPLPPPMDWISSWDRPGVWDHLLWRETECEAFLRSLQIPAAMALWDSPRLSPNGRSDLMRYFILSEFGGIYIDADSTSLLRLPAEFFEGPAWASYECDESSLIATGFMGAEPDHPLLREAARRACLVHPDDLVPGQEWRQLGPGLFTETVADLRPAPQDFRCYPYYTFLPVHPRTGSRYAGVGPVYAMHHWGTSLRCYPTK